MKQKLEAIEASIEKLTSLVLESNRRLDSIEKRLDSVEKRLDSVEKRLDSVEKRLDSVGKRLDSVERKIAIIDSRTKLMDRLNREKFASLEQMHKESQSKIESLENTVEQMRVENQNKFASIDNKLQGIEDELDYIKLGLDPIEPKLSSINSRLSSQRQKYDLILPDVQDAVMRLGNIEKGIDNLQVDLSEFRTATTDKLAELQEQVDALGLSPLIGKKQRSAAV